MLRRFCLLITLLFPTTAFAGEERNCLPEGVPLPPGWNEPYEPHRVISNLYAVGAADLSVFLITTDAGHILINTGLEDSASWIRANIDSLGFDFSAIKILLTTQAHFDHTAALAEIKAMTGAKIFATPKDVRVLEDGGISDAHFGFCLDFRFPPVSVERELADGEVITLGNTQLTTHHHPGHTEGSSSYSMTVMENGRNYRVLIANMGTINDGKRLVLDPTYPGVSDDFAHTFRHQKAMQVDVWVAAHGSQYGLADKHTPGQAYSADTFFDPDGFKAEVNRLEKLYLDQVDRESDPTS